MSPLRSVKISFVADSNWKLLNFYQKKKKKKKKKKEKKKNSRHDESKPSRANFITEWGDAVRLARNLERACTRPKRGQQRKDRNVAETQRRIAQRVGNDSRSADILVYNRTICWHKKKKKKKKRISLPGRWWWINGALINGAYLKRVSVTYRR